MSDPTCCRCEKPMRADQAYACSSCGSHLRAVLARTAKLAGEAEVAIAKLDRIHHDAPGRPDDLGWWKEGEALEAVPMPVNLGAATAYRAAAGELSTWARHIEEIRGLAQVTDSWAKYATPIWDLTPWWTVERVPHPLAVMCAEMAGSVDWLRHRQEADEAFKAIEDACRQIERIVDRPADRLVVGMCPCGTWLYAIADADTVECRSCGTGYDVEASRQQLRDNLEDRLMTGAEIATMAAHLGIITSRESARNSIKVWAQRGRITAHGSQQGSPLYRFGDTLGLLIDAYARAA